MNEALLDKRSDIPLPFRRTGRPLSRVQVLKDLEVGDSIRIDPQEFNTTHSAMQCHYNPAKRLGMKIAIRKMPDGKIRLWRVA